MTEKPKTWGDIQRKWGAIVAEYTVDQVKDLIRLVVDHEKPFFTYSLLLTLKYRFDCPDPVFDLLDEIWALQKQKAPKDEFEAWDRHARSVLRQLIGDELKSAEMLRPASSNGIH
jgi:hypothetical protein